MIDQIIENEEQIYIYVINFLKKIKNIYILNHINNYKNSHKIYQLPIISFTIKNLKYGKNNDRFAERT